MPIKVNVKIKGLVVCFLRNDEWNIVFLGDDVHPIDFKYPDGNGSTITKSLLKKGSDLNAVFEAGGFDSSTGPKGADFGAIFNMAGSYAHGPNTLIVKRRKKTTDVLWLKVPGASLNMHTLTDREYYVQELHYPGSPVEIIPAIARVLSLTFCVDGPLRLKISDPNDSSYDPPFPLPTDAGDIDLEFDNDCDDRCTHNDFIDLYELVMDKAGDRKFAAGQVRVRQHTDWKSLPAGKAMASPDYGNCDPVVVEPPPG